MNLNCMRAALLGTVALVVLGAGCAQEREPINRVQANALAKSFFIGKDLKDIADDPEFYMRGTIVDVGYGAVSDGLFTSTYAQPVSRIKWEVTENQLNARLSYERIEGTDGKGNAYNGLTKKSTNDGQIVASYVITSHFDIRRDYNQATGEETNVVVENTSDRTWNEREYMRVDWSRNLATDAYDFDTLSQLGLYGGITYEPLTYYVNDPESADAPKFDPEAGYFDITTKAFATPATIDLSSLGGGNNIYPSCMFSSEFAGGSEPYGDCNPIEITLRHSFKKVVDKDYEPVDVDGVRFAAFGNFNSDYRYGYDRNYGLLDSQWRRFAARYNLWERSHFYQDPQSMKGPIACATKETTEDPTGSATSDPNRDTEPNGTADECEAAGPGSQCDVFNHKCTLPYKDRKAVVIPWYIGGDTSEDLFEATNWAVEEWDLAMKTAIQTARLVECRKTGVDPADCDGQFPMWKGQQDDIDEAVAIARDLNDCRRKNGWEAPQCDEAAVSTAAALSDRRGGDADALAIGEVVKMKPVIVLCHNPVIDGDHPACGATGLVARLGDLRYNSVLVIEKPQTPSSWGIMVDGDDPITGEKVAASMNIWSHVTDTASQQLVDMVRYVNGELPTSEVTEGKYIRDWAQASKLSGGGQGPTMSSDEVNTRISSATKLDSAAFKRLVGQHAPAEIEALLAPMKSRLADVAVRSDVPSPQQAVVSARMKAARGSLVEADLMNPAMLQVSGVPAGLPVDGPLADAASPFALNNPKFRAQLHRMHDNAMAARGACILQEAPEASAVTGIAQALAEKFPIPADESQPDKQARYQHMFKYIQRRYHYAVLAHEMGHSIGLRHNFVSTAASLFYRPQYWQLRTQNGEIKDACTGAANEDPSKCVGPRYYDALTDEEQKNMIWMFAQSTVMDYPGDVSQDMIGLGVYDFAAARFFYGDTVSVYSNSDKKYQAGGAIGSGILQATDTFGGLAGIKYSADGADFHYSQLQSQYNVIDRCYDVTPAQPAGWNEELDGKWHQVLDGGIVTVGGQTKRCRQQPVDYVPWTQLRMPVAADLKVSADNFFYRGGPAVDPATKRVRVPYSFASDNWADTGNVSVFRHDAGADPYEQMMFLISSQENRHIFDNFRRGRTTFSIRGAADRSYSRYNEKLLGIAGGIGFFGTIYQDLGTNQGYSFDTLWPFLVDGSLKENVLAATVAFDHFARELARPEEGPHYLRDPLFNDPVLHSDKDGDDYGAGAAGSANSPVLVQIPNGSTGYLKDVGFGGHPIENAKAEGLGDYDSDFTVNAGSYYDKIHTAILLSESEDRFVSSSRRDFYDARFRAVGMADVLPEGYRRLLANALTGDRALLAPRLEADATTGKPVLDTDSTDTTDPLAKQYPARPLGWVSWWPNEGPKVCFASDGKNICEDYLGGEFNPNSVEKTLSVDPQIGWEVQKFLIAWTLAYIPANGKTTWMDMMRIFRLGTGSDPGFEERIEWQDPTSGQVYYARTYGMECLFGTGTTKATCTAAGGKWVQKGIAARVLEYANFLTGKGYQLDTSAQALPGDASFVSGYGLGFDRYGRAKFMTHPDGTPIIVPDRAIKDVSPTGQLEAVAACDQNLSPTCTPLTVYKNHYAYELQNYKSVPDYLLATMQAFGLALPDQLGVFPD